jgi:methionyl-tRNA formyltransferase
MRVVVLHDGPVGAAILEAVRQTDPDCIAKTPQEYSEWDESLGVKFCPQWLTDYRPDWLILAWWPRIIHASVIAAAKHTLNTHNSLLPWSRGKHPNFWSIVDRVPYGVSLHKVTPVIDGGDVYAREQISYIDDWEQTGDTIYKLGLATMVSLFQQRWSSIRDNPVAHPQSGGTYHEADEMEPTRTIDLDESMSARRLLNIIRAADCNGHAAHFRDGVERYSVRVKIERIPL